MASDHVYLALLIAANVASIAVLTGVNIVFCVVAIILMREIGHTVKALQDTSKETNNVVRFMADRGIKS